VFSSVDTPNGDGSGFAQVYDPASGTWSDTGHVPVALSSSAAGYELGPATLLPNGKVLQVGAINHTALYDPGTNSWTAGPDLPAGLGADDAPGVMLPNGHFLFTADTVQFTGPTRIFDYDYTNNSLTELTAEAPAGLSSQLNNPAFVDRMLQLPNGHALLGTGSGTIWDYNPNGSPDPSWAPTISNITTGDNVTYTLTGTQLTGRSQGASYGDDAEMDSNYPIVRLTSGSNVYYARTTNWTPSVATGNTSTTVNFTLPSGLPGGTYNLSVIANGIASQSTPFTPGGGGSSVSVLNSYTALHFADTQGYVPPDTCGAAGPSSYMETVNQTVAIFPNLIDNGSAIKRNLDDFYFTQGGLTRADSGSGLSDPIICYDEHIGRFIVGDQDVDFGTHVSAFDLAVSKTSTPATLTAADWNFYKITTTEVNEDADYPGNFGYNADAFTFTLNMFDAGGGTYHVQVNTISQASLSAGGALSKFQSDLAPTSSGGPFSLRPTYQHDTTVGDPLWYVSRTNDTTVSVTKLTNVLSNSPTVTTTALAVPSAPDISGNHPKQPDGSASVDNIDSRVLQVGERNHTLIASYAYSKSATEDDVRWYTFDVNGTPSISDQGDLSAGNNTYLYYPTADINANGDIGMTFMRSGTDAANDYMSVWVTGRAAGDPAGTMAAPVLVQAGFTNYDDFANPRRAGDLSAVNVAADGSFWGINEFATDPGVDNGANWGTAVAHFTITTGTGIAAAGSVTGTKYNDLNNNGLQESTEPGISGVTMFADENSDGALDSFSTNVPSADVPVTIADLATQSSTLNMSAYGVLQSLTVTFDITHTFDGDLFIELISPTGTTITLVNRRGGGGDNFSGTTLDDAAATAISSGSAPFTGTFRPESPLSTFAGENPYGVWKLRITDQAGGDVGTLNTWSINATILEPSAVTDAVGNYTINGVGPGTQHIGEVQPVGGRPAEAYNPGFESGDLYGWQAIANAGVATAALGVIPTQGNYQAIVDNASGVDPNTMDVALGQASGTFAGLGFVEGSAIKQAITGHAGETVYFDLDYLTNETPGSGYDFAFYSIGSAAGSSATIALDSSSGLVGSGSGYTSESGYRTFSYTFPSDGTYLLGVGVADTSDNVVDSAVLVDNLRFEQSKVVPSGSSIAANFGDQQLSTKVSGAHFADGNDDGVINGSDAGQAGWTVYDDANNNGVLDSQLHTFTTAPNDPIPPGAPGATSGQTLSYMTVAGLDQPITDINVTLNITHTYESDLDIYLVSPNGTTVSLIPRVGGSDDNFTNTTLDDEASTSINAGSSPYTGSYIPSQPLSTFDGQDARGVWTLRIDDDAGGDYGYLLDWTLSITTLESSAVTAADGSYSLDLPAGPHAIRDVLQPTWLRSTAPAGLAPNGGFEDGGATNWSLYGAGTTAVSLPPTEGSYALTLTTAGGLDPATLDSDLGLAAGTLEGFNTGNGSALARTITVRAGDAVSFDWAFISNDDGGTYDDSAFVSITPVSPEGVNATILEDIDSGLPRSTYHTFTHTFTQSGTYLLGVGVINVGDSSVDSQVVVDNMRLGTNAPAGGTAAVNLGVATVNPTINNPAHSVTFTENGPAQLILSPSSTVTDFDSADFNGGSLTVSRPVSNSFYDVISILNVGNGAGQIGVSGNTVKFGGNTIGTFTGGTNGVNLVVSFTTAFATPAATQALVRDIYFNNASDNPYTPARTVRFTLTDGDGGSSITDQQVSVVAVNDAPTLSGPSSLSTLTNTNVVFSTGAGTALTMADLDAGTSQETLRLQSTGGKLSLSTTSGLTFLAGSNGTADFTIKGTLTSINNALQGSAFVVTANFTGSASLVLTANDLGFTGTGGAKTATKTVAIAIKQVIDNGDPGYAETAGTWNASGLVGYNGTTSRFSSSANAAVTWTPAQLSPGFYTVELFKLNSQSSAVNAQLSVVHDNTTETQTIDLRSNSAGFVQVPGVFYFDGTVGAEYVKLAQGATVGNLRADAVRFTQVAAPVSIVDNGDPGYTENAGSWSTSGLVGYNGTSSRFSSSSNAAVTWTPTVSTAGFYQVEIFKLNSQSSSINAQLSVKHHGVTATQTIDLRSNAAGFVSVGTFYFDGAGSEFVKLVQGATVSFLRADAVRLTKVGTPVTVVDNGTAGYAETAGTWGTSGLTGYNGSSTRYSASSNAAATWTPTLAAGYYAVAIYKPLSNASSVNAVVTVKHNGITETQILDERSAVGGFYQLGVYYFSGAGGEFVKLAQGATVGNLRADAVRFKQVDAAIVIVDNGTPGYVEGGSWNDSGLTGFNGSSTRYSVQTTATATWTPVLAAGNYMVSFYRVSNATNQTNATLTINHNGANDSQSINLTGASGFVDLGVFTFSGSGTEFLRLSQTTAGTLRADAVRFTKV
jgi:subtilisin-like proprotein convertase family protein